MKNRLFALVSVAFLFSTPGMAVAEESVGYQIVHPDGTVEFTDDANSGGKEIKLQDLQTVGESPESSDEQEYSREYTRALPRRDRKRTYSVLRILAPTADEVLWYTDGRLGVRLKLHPDLSPGHTIQYTLDGNPVGLAPETALTIPGPVFRGTHTISVSVVDGRGNVLISASPVTFHVKQPGK